MAQTLRDHNLVGVGIRGRIQNVYRVDLGRQVPRNDIQCFAIGGE